MALGKYAVDYEKRVDYDRLRKERLERAKDQINKDGLGGLIGRHSKIPEGIDKKQCVFLMGECTRVLKKKLEEADINCFHVYGCPPAEPFLCSSIVDRQEYKEITA